MTQPAKQHLPFGGSSAHVWLACAGSVARRQTLPPQPETEHMKRGTRAHALLEYALRNRLSSVMQCKNKCLKAHDPVFDAEDVEAVQVALEYVNDILAQYPDALTRIEAQVALSAEVGGTADVVIYVPSLKKLFVIDYKHGVGIFVSAFDNKQLKLYGSATLMTFTEGPVAQIECVIVQPRSFVGSPIRSCTYTPVDLMNYVDDVEEAVSLAKAPNPPIVPGEVQCYDCPVAPTCREFQNAIIDGITFGPTWERENMSGELTGYAGVTLTIPDADAIKADPKALADVMRAAGILRTWIGAIEDHAEAFVRAGHVLPGFKLVQTRPRRKWINEAEAAKWIDENTILDIDDYNPREMKTVAQVETLVKKGNKQGVELVKKLAEHSESKSSGMKLVPESAAGDAIPLAEVLAITGGDAGDVIS